MPLQKTQSVLKRILPWPLFRFLYNVADECYRVLMMLKTEFIMYSCIVFCAALGDEKGLNRALSVRKVEPYSMVGIQGLFRTYDIAKSAVETGLNGAFVECGVARGGCGALMALAGSDRQIWLFDTFNGLPEPTKEDEYSKSLKYDFLRADRQSDVVAPGYCLGTYEGVSLFLFKYLELPQHRIHIIKGLFQDTIPMFCKGMGGIAVLRIDADWYASTKSCLEILYDNVVDGGYIIIDDYNSTIGCQKATDEFIESRQLNVNMTFDNRGGCYFRKSQ